MTQQETGSWEDELDAIRLQLYEETKYMTPEEWSAYHHAKAEPIMKQYNLKWATLEPADFF